MKKNIIWILPLAVFVLVVILYQVPHVYRFWFNVRHVLLYGLGAYVLMGLLFIASKSIFHFFKIPQSLKLALQGVFGMAFIVGLVLLGNLQMHYIELYEVPPLKRCIYYDAHGNLLYMTQYPRQCTELEEVRQRTEDGKEVLAFSLEETFNGPARTYLSSDEGLGISAFDLEATLEVNVSLTYMDKRFVEKVEISAHELQHKTNAYDGAKTTTGKSWVKVVENTMDDEAVTVTVKSGDHSVDSPGHVTMDFPEKGAIPMQEVALSTLKYDKDESTSYVDISKTEFDGEEEVTTRFLRGEYRSVNGPLFMMDFYEGDRFNGSTFDAYFEHDAVTLVNKVESSQWHGVESEQAQREVRFIQTPTLFYDYSEESEHFVLNAFESDLGRSYDAYDTDYLVDYFETGGSIYAEKEDVTSKFIKTDYGYLVKDYSTRRYSNGSYYPSLEPENTYSVSVFDGASSMSIPAMYDYEAMLYHPGRLTDYHFYQHNFLLEGLFLQTKD